MNEKSDYSLMRGVIISAIFLVIFAIALVADGPVAREMRDSGLDASLHAPGYAKWIADIIKAPGVFYFTIVLALVVAAFHRLGWRAGAFVLICGFASGANWFIKWVVGRTRPFQLPRDIPQPAPFYLRPFVGGWHGLFHTPALDFPSGHASLSFATASAMGILLPRWRWVFFVIAGLVGVERIVENAHYVSDVVAGAALGIGVAWIVRRLAGRRLLSAGEMDQGAGFEVLPATNTAANGRTEAANR